MERPIEESDNIWVRNLNQLKKLDKEWRKYKEQGRCEWADCRVCNYQNVCDEWSD